ncbi:Cupin domain protein [Amycolatopsis marina]|uniref:Cupin domain protein n=1 Tax=Amycolatopsis marina TaxID=490629 RepID=A0A1I1APH2_9PSEU|nr:quercetin 2,3-dioxygenase [Amycolatopsis marina]SFB39939.1 Cupin domain protein [Amycolatopsis marina]
MHAPFQTTSADARALWHMGALLRLKATGEDTAGQFSLTEHTCRQGTASPLHRHTREDEAFLVLEGELRIYIDGRHYHAQAGSLTFAPRGLPHAYRATSPTCRFLALITPGGFEQWFAETGEPALSPNLPPAPSGPVDTTRLISAAARYGVEVLGPSPIVDDATTHADPR